MRTLILALLLASFTGSAQYESNPNQQTVWLVLKDVAPVHEMLKACERDVIAGMLWDYVQQRIAPVVGTDDNWRIVNDMWTQARREARFRDQQLLVEIIQDPNGEAEQVCNLAERHTVNMIGAGA